ncbi:MAG: Na/Pi symporter [Lentisphaeria bacterium]|nr:Na/Pi symporter [Lentisphaeria bacterium]
MKIKNWLKSCFVLCVSAAVISGVGGCKKTQKEEKVDQIKIVQGADQLAMPGKAFESEIKVELLSAPKRGLFGGKGSRKVLADRAVFVSVLNGSALEVEKKEYKSDIAGVVAIPVKAKNLIGDHYLQIKEAKSGKSVTIRLGVGMEICGTMQEVFTGHEAGDELKVKMVDANGIPLKNIPVYFSISQNPEGMKTAAKLASNKVLTDENGVAVNTFTAGGKTGEYFIDIEASAPEKNVFFRTRSVKMYGIGFWNVIVTVAGGLAIFILGMKLMSEGLQKIAGDKMKKILQLFSQNAAVAALAGTAVTAVIQSSSATTVMVIGFINAGLLNLVQSIGIIFGANVGTTVTAQIISFNLDGLALPAVIIGFLITISKKRVINGWGNTILGFGLLFFGMMMMSNELKLLGNFPSFIDFFRTFDCAPEKVGGFMPIGAVIGALGIGTLMTVIIQSSSAAMGIVLALAAGGLINFYTAIPLLLGTNIGTTITAFLAALAANRVAKQAALAHTLFNVFGSVVMLILFYVPFGAENRPVFLYFINAITPGDAFAEVPQNLERHIAMAHTFFNVVVVLLLLPVINLFARICSALIPVKDEAGVKFEMLEPHLLNTPSIAIEQAVNTIRVMTRKAWHMVDTAVNDIFMKSKIDEELFEKLAEKEKKVDAMQEAITDYLVKITRHELSEPQSALVPLLMHCTNDAERIADHTENIINLTERMVNSDKKLSEGALIELKYMSSLLNRLAENVLQAIHGTEGDCVERALKLEGEINQLAKSLEDNHIDRLQQGKCTLDAGIIFIEMVGEMEKVGDHLVNIAERAPEIQKHYIKI